MELAKKFAFNKDIQELIDIQEHIDMVFGIYAYNPIVLLSNRLCSCIMCEADEDDKEQVGDIVNKCKKITKFEKYYNVEVITETDIDSEETPKKCVILIANLDKSPLNELKGIDHILGKK